MRSGDSVTVGIDFTVNVAPLTAKNMEAELQQVLADLGLGDQVKVERS